MQIDNTSATGKMIRQMMAVLGEFDRNNTVEAISDGLARKARNGEMLPSTTRLGYEWSEVDERGKKALGATLVIVSEEAELVRLIYTRYEETAPSTLARWLNDQGHLLPRKVPAHRRRTGETHRFFDIKDVNRIVTDPLYTGTVEWGRTTTIPGKTPIIQTHHFPDLQIISFEQFMRVQRLRQQRRRVPTRSATSTYIFSGLVRCPKCGGKTTGEKKNYPRYEGMTRIYVCRAYHQYGKAGCEGWQVLESSVTKAVVPFVADLLENKLGLRQYVEEEARNMVLEQQGDRMKRLKGQVEAARSQLKRVQELTVQGLMTPEEAKPFIYEARETIERGENQLTGLEKTIVLQKELADAVSRVCADIEGALERLDRPALQAIVRQVFTRFTIGKQRRYRGTLDTWIESYEFRHEIQDLLAQGVHIGESHRSARPS